MVGLTRPSIHSSRVDFREFHNRIFAALHAIVAHEESNPLTAAIPAQKDLPTLLASVRTVAEEMALCKTLETTIATLRADRAALLGTLWLTTHLSGQDVVLAARRAYAASPQDSSALPGYPVAAFLIELCEGLGLVKRPPKT